MAATNQNNQKRDSSLKIMYISDGRVHLNANNLIAVIKASVKKSARMPVAFLSVVGEKRSGKSFYSNLLLKYLNNPKSSWLTKFSSDAQKTKVVDGFYFGEVSLDENLCLPCDEAGIYIWRKPVSIKNFRGKILVWILHLSQYSDDMPGSYANNRVLNSLLIALSSRITSVIKWNDEGAYLNYTKNILPALDEWLPKYMLCKSILYLLRKKPTSEEHCNSGNPVQPYHTQEDILREHAGKIHKHVEILSIDENTSALEEKDGRLKKMTEKTHIQLDKAIKEMGNSNLIVAKQHEDETVLNVEKIQTYFTKCISVFNEYLENNYDNCNHELSYQPDNAMHYSKPFDSGQSHSKQFDNITSTTNDPDIIGTTPNTNKNEIRNVYTLKSAEAKANKGSKPKDFLDRFFQAGSSKHSEQAHKSGKGKLELTSYNQIGSTKPTQEQQTQYAVDMEMLHNILGELKFQSNLTNTEFTQVSDNLKRFNAKFIGCMKTTIFIEPEKLENMLVQQSEFKNDTPTVRRLTEDSCKRLIRFFRDKTLHLQAYEYKIGILIIEQIQAKCQQAWQNILDASIYPAPDIKNVRSQLEEKSVRVLINSFVSSCIPLTYRKLPHFMYQSIKKHLQQELATCYKNFLSRYSEKLKKYAENILRLVIHHKSLYCTKIDNLLTHYPEGLSDFDTDHKQIKTDIEEKLIADIRKTVSETEPVTQHLKTFESHIQKVWNAFKETNAKKLQSAQTPMPGVDLNSINSSENDAKCSQISQEKRTSISIPISIIFQLSLNEIKVHLNEEKHSLNFKSFPAVIALTKDNVLVCGTYLDIDLGNSNYKQYWYLKDFLLGKPFISNQVVVSDGISLSICAELLLGYIFHAIKEEVENQITIPISVCVITIPFWLTSKQRQMVKDSSKLAGFKETILLNENSAIALRWSLSSTINEHQVVVIFSENSDYIDATIYTVKNYAGVEERLPEVKMVGHHSAYDLRKIFLTPGLQSTNLEPTINKALEEAHEIANANSEMKSVKEISVLISTTSDTLLSLLTSKIQNFKIQCLVLNNPCMVAEGACLFSKKPQAYRKKVMDRLSSDIMRSAFSGIDKVIQSKQLYCISENAEDCIVKTELHIHKTNGTFFQYDVTGCKVEIGKLELQENIKYATSISTKVAFCISSESIVRIHTIQAEGNHRCVWAPSNLDGLRIGQLTAFIAGFKKVKHAQFQKEKARETAVNLANKLLELINSSNLNFKSELAKSMMINQINDALELLKNPVILENDVLLQIDAFKRYETKLGRLSGNNSSNDGTK